MSQRQRPGAADAAIESAPAAAPLSRESVVAGEVKALVAAGEMDAARERFAELVDLQQRIGCHQTFPR